jgi:hypothetical protein
VRWLLGCQWWWRCRRRSHRTGESDRASALTRLALDLPADQRPAVLGQALAAATVATWRLRPRAGVDRTCSAEAGSRNADQAEI